MIKSLYKGFNFGDFDTSNFFNTSGSSTGEVESSYYDVIKNTKEGAVVVDIGASTGVISWLALKSNPTLKHIHMVEPNPPYIELIKQNFKDEDNWTLTERIISDKVGLEQLNWDELDITLPSTTFKELIRGIGFENRIDLLKIDIEGGEYHIFTEQYVNYLNYNVGDMVVEFHTSTQEDKEKFRYVRDKIIPKLMFTKTIDVYALDDVNICWDYWNEHFIEYYNCFMMVLKDKR